jgi:hypothetical protein
MCTKVCTVGNMCCSNVHTVNKGIHNVRHGYCSYRYEGSIVIGIPSALHRVCHRVVHGLIIRIPELWSTVFSFTALSTRVCTGVSTE